MFAHHLSSCHLLASTRLAVLICGVLLITDAAQAQTTYYWEPNAPNDGTLTGGAGAWNSTNAFFTPSATDAGGAIAWPTGIAPNTKNTVVFGGTTAGTVTLSALTAYTPTGGTSTTTDLLLNNLTFATTGYTLTGGQIRFVYNGTTNGAITVNPGLTATLNSNINGAAAGGLTVGTADGNISNNVLINGGGTLNLGGGNGSVGFTIANGTTVVKTGTSTFSGNNATIVDGILRLDATATNALANAATRLGGSGTFDLNGISAPAGIGSTTGNISGTLSITNTTSTASTVFSLNAAVSTQTHTGVISDGAGKLSLAFTGIFNQGNNFSSTNSFNTQTLAGSNTYTGFTSLGRGAVTLDFSNAAAPASNILYNAGFGTPSGDDGKLIIARPTMTINTVTNSASGSLATMTLTGKASTANSQQFNGLKLEANSAANLFLNPGATGGTLTLNLGSTLERSAGSLINFATTGATTALSASATINATFGTASTVLKDANGVAFAVLGGRDWAAKNATNDAVIAVTYTDSTPGAFTANADIRLPVAGGAANDVRLSSSTTISTLKFSESARSGVHLGGTTLTTGGILVSAVNTSSGNFITGGTITSPGSGDSDIVLFSSGTSLFGLDAVLANGAAATGFTKGGNGIVLQTENNTFTGVLNIHSGGLIVRGTNTASAININGSSTNLTSAHLPQGDSTGGSYLQLGNADASGSLGSGEIQLGVNALLAIKRSDSLTLNNNVRGTGSLTQGWSGTTTLLSAGTAKYTYVGDTTVTAGTLKLDYTASNTGILSDSTRLVLGGGTVEYATVAGTTHNDIVRDTLLISGASTITKTGAGAGRLRLNSFNTLAAGSTLNFTAASIADTDTSNTSGILGSTARFTVGTAGTYDWAFSAASGAADTAITALNSASYAAAATSGSNTSNSRITDTDLTLVGSLTTNTLKIENGSGSTQTVDIGAANTLTLTAGGLLLTGANAVEINNGILRSNTATNSDLVIHQHNTGGLTIGSVIANGNGASTLTKSGNGTLTLGGTNTYTGQTYLNGGTTIISANVNLGAAATGATLNLNNATLRVTADVILSNGVVGTNNRAVVLNGLGGTFEVDATRTLTIGGAISGPGGLTKTGNGLLDIRSASNLFGPTTITAGTLRFGAAVNPVRTDVTIGAVGTLDIFGFGNTIGSLSGSGIVTNTGAAATFTVGSTHLDTTFAGQLTNGANALNLDKIGAGTLTLTGGSNNYTGATTISGGGLVLNGSGILPSATALNLSSATSFFDISGITAPSLTTGSLAGVALSRAEIGDRELITGSASSTFSGILSGTGGILTKVGAGTLTLAGANTYTGATNINVGVISITNGSALGTTAGSTIVAATGSITTGGRLQISGTISTAENITFTGTSETGSFSAPLVITSGTNTLSGTITLTDNNGYRFQTDAGASITFSGNIVRSDTAGGALRFTSFGTGGTTIVDNAIDNNGGLLENLGAGLLLLNATGNDIGATTIYSSFSSGTATIRIGADHALNQTSSLTIGIVGTTVRSDIGTFDLNGRNQTIGGLNGSINTSATPSATDQRLVTNSANATTSLFTLGNGNGSGTFDGVIEDGAGSVAVTKTGTGTQTLSGTLANTYTGSTLVEGGTLALAKTAGVNAIAGNLTIGDGTGTDVVQLTNSNQIADTSVVTFNGTGANAGILRLNNQSETLAGLNSTGGAGIVENESGSASTGTLTVNIAAGTQTFSGTLRDGNGAGTDGTLALAKDGAGTQVLSGNNTYTGTTTITSGTLLVNNSSGSGTGTGDVTVNSGATLGGVGILLPGNSKAFTVNSGGTLQTGNGTTAGDVGTLTVTLSSGGFLTLADGSTTILDISSPNVTDATFGGNTIGSAGYNAYLDSFTGLGSGSHDLLVVNGANSSDTLTFSGTLQVRSSSFTASAGQVFNLLDWSNVASVSFSGFTFNSGFLTGNGDEGLELDLPDLTGTGLLWDFSRFTTSGVIAVVPEPSRALLLLAGVGALVLRRRRAQG